MGTSSGSLTRWVNLINGVPIAANFQTTSGAGTPIDVDQNTGTPYILVGQQVRPLNGGVYVNVKWFGAKGDGVTDDTAAIVAAVAYILSVGGGTLYFPRGTYITTGSINLCPNITLLGEGKTVSVISSASTASAPTLICSDPYIALRHIGMYLSAGSDIPWHINVDDAFCTVEDCLFSKVAGTGGYHGYFRYGSDHFRFLRNDSINSNGWYVEGSNFLIAYSKFIGRTSGGDDAIAIKSVNGLVQNGRIEGNYFESLSDMVAIGSEVGTFGADDPTYAKQVLNIDIVGNVAQKVSYGVFIKPGGGGSDYRNGLVSNINISDNSIEDLNGDKYNNFIFMVPSRTAIIDGVYGRNNSFRGRAAGDESTGFKSHILITNNDGATGSHPQILNVDLEVNGTDYYNGAAHGTAGVPGWPTINGINIQDNTSTHTNLFNIHASGIFNGLNGDGARLNSPNSQVFIDRLYAFNVTGNGIDSDGPYILGEYNISCTGTTFAGFGSSFVAKKMGAIALQGSLNIGTGSFAGNDITLTGANQVVICNAPVGNNSRVELQINGTQIGIFSSIVGGGIQIGTPFSGAADIIFAPYGGTRATITAAGINLANTMVLQNNGLTVLGPRQTGWAAASGTATRTTFATSTVTLPQLAEHVKALIDDLMTHGMIGP